jgi:hypothetical protein
MIKKSATTRREGPTRSRKVGQIQFGLTLPWTTRRLQAPVDDQSSVESDPGPRCRPARQTPGEPAAGGMRFTSQTGRHHDGTLDQLTLYPVDLIQVGDSHCTTPAAAATDSPSAPPAGPVVRHTTAGGVERGWCNDCRPVPSQRKFARLRLRLTYLPGVARPPCSGCRFGLVDVENAEAPGWGKSPREHGHGHGRRTEARDHRNR